MIKTAAVLCVRAFIEFGGAPFVQPWFYTILYQFVKIILWFEIPALANEFMTIGTRLLVLFFEEDQDRLALDMSTIGIRLLQKSVKRKSGKRRHGATLEEVSKTFVRGLNEARRRGYEDRMNALMDDRIGLFIDAIQKNDGDGASNFSKLGIVLLMASIEEAMKKRIDPSTTKYLSRYWVEAMDSAAENRQPLVQALINTRASDMNGLYKRGIFTYGTLLKALMEVVQMAIKQRKSNVVKMLSKSTVEVLHQAIKDGHRANVDAVLSEGVAAIVQAIRCGDRTEMGDLSEVGQEMLVAAVESKAYQLASIMSEFWLTELDRAASDGHSEAVYSLIDARTVTLYETMRNNNTETNSVWGAGIETLLAAIRIKSEKLVVHVSASFVNALVDTKAKFGEELVGSLANVSIREFTEAINSGDNHRADMLTMAGLEIMVAAINLNESLLAKDLAYAWIAGLDTARTISEGAVDSLIEARTMMFNKAMVEGNKERAGELAAAGMELLLASVNTMRPAATRSVAKSLMRGLAGAINQNHKQMVDSLISVPTKLFLQAVSRGNLKEAELYSMAASELFFAAVDEGETGLVEKLSLIWVKDLAAAVKENREMAEKLVRKVGLWFGSAAAKAGEEEIKALSNAMRIVLQAANDIGDSTVIRLIETWAPLLE
jgi:hypothetical protein